MSSSLDRWNLRHRESAGQPPPNPAAFLVECFPLLPRPHPASRALDLACGAGQNAIYLAERHWPVVAVDFAHSALDRAAALAASRHVPVQRAKLTAVPDHFSGVLLLAADLSSVECGSLFTPTQEGLPLFSGEACFPVCPHPLFDLLLCFNYLDRNLFPHLELSLRPGGHLLYETFTELQLARPEGPRNPAHLLRSGELRTAFPSLDVLFYRECQSPQAIASLLARKPR